MVNEQDYKNAQSIIKQCKDYTSKLIKENNGIIPNVNLIKLGEFYHHLRGNTEVFLSIDWRGLIARNYCADHTTWEYSISNDGNCAYAYNNSKERTIEVAIKLADNWESIKSKLNKAFETTKEVNEINSKTLANFKI